MIEYDQEQLLETYIGVVGDLKIAIAENMKLIAWNVDLEIKNDELLNCNHLLSKEFSTLESKLTSVQESKNSLIEKFNGLKAHIEKREQQVAKSNLILAKSNKEKKKFNQVLSMDRPS